VFRRALSPAFSNNEVAGRATAFCQSVILAGCMRTLWLWEAAGALCVSTEMSPNKEQAV